MSDRTTATKTLPTLAATPIRWQSTEVGDDYDGWGEDV